MDILGDSENNDKDTRTTWKHLLDDDLLSPMIISNGTPSMAQDTPKTAKSITVTPQAKGQIQNPDSDSVMVDIGDNRNEDVILVQEKQEQQQISEQQTEKVAILDFGAQYGKVIDRRVRECNVYSDILPFNITMHEILQRGYSAIIISGGPNSVYAQNALHCDPAIFSGKLPVLGICYGFQLINKHFGGSVSGLSRRREDGSIHIKVDTSSELFNGLDQEQLVLLTHGDIVTEGNVAPGEFRIIAWSNEFIQGIANPKLQVYGVQFHPEVDLTQHGQQMLSNFLRRICSLKCLYTLQNREQQCLNRIQRRVGDQQHVLVLCSGGVDSTVCAALCTKALKPERVHAIHIDNGFMRLNESEHVVCSLNALGLKVNYFNYVNEFLDGRIIQDGVLTSPLKLVTCPEMKRKIIGDTFIRCKDIAIKKLDLSTDIFLVQGTLRPDLIESASLLASGCADTIKTHHNDSALVRQLRNLGKVVEPLQDFHKDEVRELGHTLGLPDHIVHRHPFPGPGLAIRILCADEPFKDEQFNDTQLLVNQITQGANPNFGCMLLPVKSVGVQGDCRTYSYVAALTCNCSDEEIPWNDIEQLARSLPNAVNNVNRVVFVFHQRISHFVEDITRTHINEGTLQLLQKADHIVYQTLQGLDADGNQNPRLQNVLERIQQMPVVLVPVHLERIIKPPQYFPSIKRCIVLRPFLTRDFMTGQPALPGRDLPYETVFEMVGRIEREMAFTISRVMLDVTSKPPGTTEWE